MKMDETKPQLLIVDNEVEICSLFKDFFDFMGYESTYETDGEKALENLESYRYDLLFLDLNLESMSGVEILKKSKIVHPLSEVIVVTGYGSDTTVLQTMNYGALSYIQKPISFKEIKAQTELGLAQYRSNIRSERIGKLLGDQDPGLEQHFHTMSKIERLTRVLSLSIDIDTVADSLLISLSELLPGLYFSLFIIDDNNNEMIIYSPTPITSETVNYIESSITSYYVSVANHEIEQPYSVRTSLSTVIDESGNSPDDLDSIFVPIFIESSVNGAIGVTGREKSMPTDALDILRLVATRASHVFTNATLHRDTKLLAYTDGLTGLLNHRAFKDRFDREFERFTRYGSYLSIILADFDDLKIFNDTYGHPVGDEILRKIGDILRETSRDSDVLARYGGDEFVILLPQTNENNACNMAERIREKVESYPFVFNGTPAHVTMTMGVATLPREGVDTPLKLLEYADRALYEAKRMGKNKVMIANYSD